MSSLRVGVKVDSRALVFINIVPFNNISRGVMNNLDYTCVTFSGFISSGSIYSAASFQKVRGLIAFKQWRVCGLVKVSSFSCGLYV